MNIFIIAFSSIFLSVAAQFALKAGMAVMVVKNTKGILSPDFIYSAIRSPWLIVGFFLYGLSAIIWLEVLAKWDVSKAYPLVGFGFVLTAFFGFCIGESVTLYRLLGIFLISSGVIFVSNS